MKAAQPTIATAQGVQPLNQIPAPLPINQINAVRCLLREAWHRVKAYPFAPSYQSKLVVIEKLTAAMNNAEATPNGAARCRMILRIELDLQYLAPAATLKRRTTYLARVERIMADCRHYLGWRAQQ